MEKEKDKIREELIRYLPWCEDISKDTKERWISWLESQKQVENMADRFDSKFERKVASLFDSILNGDVKYTENFIRYTSQILLGYAKYELNNKRQ